MSITKTISKTEIAIDSRTNLYLRLLTSKSLLAGVAAASTLFLAACGSSSNSSKGTTYNYVYGTDPDSLNYLTSNRSTTSDITTNLVDGLFENDQYGNLVPALVEDWSVSKDGLTYTCLLYTSRCV